MLLTFLCMPKPWEHLTLKARRMLKFWQSSRKNWLYAAVQERRRLDFFLFKESVMTSLQIPGHSPAHILIIIVHGVSMIETSESFKKKALERTLHVYPLFNWPLFLCVHIYNWLKMLLADLALQRKAHDSSNRLSANTQQRLYDRKQRCARRD